MSESTDSIIHELKTYSMIRTKYIERHICTGIHGIRIMFETSHLKSIGHSHIQFIFLAYCCWVKRRLHRPIMAEGNIILCTRSRYVQYDK